MFLCRFFFFPAKVKMPTTMEGMFAGTSSFNGNISTWGELKEATNKGTSVHASEDLDSSSSIDFVHFQGSYLSNPYLETPLSSSGEDEIPQEAYERVGTYLSTIQYGDSETPIINLAASAGEFDRNFLFSFWCKRTNSQRRIEESRLEMQPFFTDVPRSPKNNIDMRDESDPNEITLEFIESERWLPFASWSPSHLTMTDFRRFMPGNPLTKNLKGAAHAELESPPKGYVWISNREVEEWYYKTDFPLMYSRFAGLHCDSLSFVVKNYMHYGDTRGCNQLYHFVRCRILKRTARRIDTGTHVNISV